MHHLLGIPRAARPLLSGLAIALSLLTACSSGGSNSDAVDAAKAQNEDKISAADITDKQQADAEFVVNAASNALLQVELGKLAQARATTPVVRTYGTKILQHRLELLAALRALAAVKNLAIPATLGEDGQAAYHDVSTKTGSELDKQLMALLLKTQKQDEDAFDDMKDDAYDGDIRGFAAKYLEPVREQLATADEVNDAIEDLP